MQASAARALLIFMIAFAGINAAAQAQSAPDVNNATSEAPPELAAALLPQIRSLIELRAFGAAESLLEQTQTLPMSQEQLHMLKLLQAKLALARGRYKLAAGLLQLLDAPDLSSQTMDELLWMQADALQALGRHAESAAALLRRDTVPQLPNRLDAHPRILAAIDSLSALELSLLRARSPNSEGWIALSEFLAAPPQQHLPAARLWRAKYRGHAATRLMHQRLTKAIAGKPYLHIALLLPLASSFGEPARAFYEGFIAAHAEDPSGIAVTLHDIGDDAAITPLFAQSAISDGADFLVGPLGRKAVNALLENAPPPAPTLLVGNVPADKVADTLYGISLSPEREASKAAERAFRDGHRQAGIASGNASRSRRIANAFALRWRALGGELVGDVIFPADISDHSKIIRELLGLDRSVARARTLSAQLGVRLEFTPRRRDDIDFLFLAAGASEARLLAPQLRFFQAHNLPVYATSQVYDGKPNPVLDADLDGILFCDMNWMIDAVTTPDWRAPSPYHHTELDRLYALGRESYHVIPALARLRRNPELRHFGEAVEVSVRADGNVVRHPQWARFEGGLPAPVAVED